MTSHMRQTEAATITLNLLADHGLGHWGVGFSQSRSSAGFCNYSRRAIRLSVPMLKARTYEGSLDTIRHEVAHAITPGHNHDRVWAAVCKALGGRGERCFDSSTVVDDTSLQGEYVGTCPAGHVSHKYRKPKVVQSFGRCSRSFSDANLFAWTYKGNALTWTEDGDRLVFQGV